jgi:hypothetical protein
VSRPPAGETVPFNVVDLRRGLGGVQILVRFSLGVVF